MPKYRSKPKEVEAFQWSEGMGCYPGNNPGGVVKHGYLDLERIGFHVTTIHGQRTHVAEDDWIITEPDGEHHYPVKPDIFKRDYELIDE